MSAREPVWNDPYILLETSEGQTMCFTAMGSDIASLTKFYNLPCVHHLFGWKFENGRIFSWLYFRNPWVANVEAFMDKLARFRTYLPTPLNDRRVNKFYLTQFTNRRAPRKSATGYHLTLLNIPREQFVLYESFWNHRV